MTKSALAGKTFGVTRGGYYADGAGGNWQLYPHSILTYSRATSSLAPGDFHWTYSDNRT